MFVREGCKGPCEGVCIPCDCDCNYCCIGCCVGCCSKCDAGECKCFERTNAEKKKFKQLKEDRDWND